MLPRRLREVQSFRKISSSFESCAVKPGGKIRASIAATLNATALQCSHKLLPQSTCGNYGPFRFWSGEAISYRDALVKEGKRAYAGCTEAKGGGAEARKGCNALRTCMGKCPWLYDSIMIFTRAAVVAGEGDCTKPAKN